MKSLIITASLALILVPAVCRAQGSLTPPAGVPTPTMKSLDELWDKIPVPPNRIPISSLPYTIGAAGVYYLTQNLDFSNANGDAIVIGANHVTLDLNGFRILSGNGVSGDAIKSTGALNLKIMNGRIQGGTTITINGLSWTMTANGFTTGINISGSTDCVLEDLVVSGCRSNGIALGGTSALRNIRCFKNGLNGIISNGADNVFSHCLCTYNFNFGIYAPSSLLSACVASYNGGAGIASSGGGISNCLARYNKFDGIVASNGVISFSTASNNNQSGLSYQNINASGASRSGNLPSP